LVTDVATTGYVQIVLGNAASTPVWFDDVQASAVQHIEKPAKTAPAEESKNSNAPYVTNKLLEPTCTEYTDTYYNTVTGEVLWVEKYTVCPDIPPGDGGDTGGGGGGGGTGDGGTGTSPTQCRACGYNPPPTSYDLLTRPQLITHECDGLKQALGLQSQNGKEVAGMVMTDGTVLLLPMQDNDVNHTKTDWPIKDYNGHTIVPAPYQENGVWKVDYNIYLADGTRVAPPLTYTLAYYFHTHPGPPYKPDEPSPEDKALASDSYFAGVRWKIVNANNVVEYDATHVISTSPNSCR
jgi:hypothetical protein